MAARPIPFQGIPVQGRAEALAAGLPPLLLDAKRVAATIQQGVHSRRRAGPGDGFWQYRRYQSGDPATAIDWRQSAKSEPLYVRETEWASAQTVWLWSDHSASMRWHSDPSLPNKQDRADLLLLALAIGLVSSGERVALLDRAMTPAADPGTPGRLAAALLASPAEVLTAMPRHGRVVLFSDFLMPLAEVESRARRLAEHDFMGHMVQILDPAEESLPYNGRIVFEGLEDEGEMLADHVQSLGKVYRDALGAHRDALSAIAKAVGWRFTLHHTDAAPTLPLVALHASLASR